MKQSLLTVPIALLSLILILTTSCKEDDDNEPDRNDFSGSIKLFDESGVALSDSGMTVGINGTSAVSITDNEGVFTFSNLEFGNHLLVFNKEGFGEHIRSVSHPQSETPNFLNEFINLGQISTADLVSLDASLNSGFLSLSIASEPQASVDSPRYFHIFFHNQPDVSTAEYTTFETRDFSLSPSNYNKSTNFFYNSGFDSGDEIFIAVYTTSKYDNSYFDSSLGRDVFPNINPETLDPVSFVLP